MSSRTPDPAVYGLTAANLLATLPDVLRQDPSVAALAEAVSELLAGRPEEIDRLRIYPAIDALDEPLLDILAYDFKVDWWDADYSVEEKRRTLKSSWKVHKTLGTKVSVETALRAIYLSSKAEAWFEYGGEPYHFRLHINLTGEQLAQGKPANVLNRVKYYQSLRDHMDAIQYTVRLPPVALCIGSSVGMQTERPIPADTAPPSATAILRAGGVVTMIAPPFYPNNEER